MSFELPEVVVHLFDADSLSRGDLTEVNLLISQADPTTGHVPAAALVNAYLGLGDSEQAFIWIDDPGFADLVIRVGLG